MNNVSTGVFDRFGRDSISSRGFFFILGAVLVWGLGGTAFIANEVSKSGWEPGWLAIIGIGLIVPIIGIMIAVKSDNPLISFVGYNLVIIPFGIILSPIVNHYRHELIRNAFLVTSCVTGIMMLLGTLYPEFFSKIGRVLFLSLLGLLGVRLLQLFIPGFPNLGIIDWIAAAIFSLYIGYDWYRANNVPKTIDNAVDIALDIYLDFINLFINILSIMSKSDD